MVAEIIAVGGLVVTVLLAYMKIQKNQEANIRLQEAHLRNQLKIQIYQEVAPVIHDAVSLLSKTNADIVVTRSTLQTAASGYPMSPTTAWSDLHKNHLGAAQAMGHVLGKLEQYEIVFARFGTTRRQLSEEHNKLLSAFTPLSGKLAPFLMHRDEKSGKTVGPLAKPGKEDLTNLKDLQRAYSTVCADIQGYLMDLQIEAQNELLGVLFDRELPSRSPTDPKAKVLTRDTEAPTQRPPGRLV